MSAAELEELEEAMCQTYDEWVARDPRDFDPSDEEEPELTEEDYEELAQRGRTGDLRPGPPKAA